MNADQILNEIREANLSYLMLAQSLIRTDRDQALYRLGISEESASLIALLTPAQMMKIAAGNTLLCRSAWTTTWSGACSQPRQERRQRQHQPPARLDPDGRPPFKRRPDHAIEEHPHRKPGRSAAPSR